MLKQKSVPNVTIVTQSNLFFPNVGTGGADDLLLITGSNNYLRTYGGNDIVVTSGYGNYVNLGDGDDIAVDVGGEADFFGGKGNDGLFGGTGNNWLMGGDGADILVGGGGNDIIIFDVEDSLISGGKGADVFRFEQRLSHLEPSTSTQGFFFKPVFLSGVTSIVDFNAGEGDTLDMSVLGENVQVLTDVVTNTTLFVGQWSTIALVGVSFPNTDAAIAAENLILG